MSRALIVHHDKNVPKIENFQTLEFHPKPNIDHYISTKFLKQLKEIEFDTLFIKDNLSKNYLDLYGLRLAHHIRLTEDLKDKRFVPIVIISDLDIATLNRLSKLSLILFTKNVYLVSNSKADILNHQKGKSQKEIDIKKFLKSIVVEKPEQNSHHDIANEWAIYRWAEILGVQNEKIEKNYHKIADSLYFKYLQNSLHSKETDTCEIKEIKSKGKRKILYVDDEWQKGWKDILNRLFSRSDILFECYEGSYENKITLLNNIKERVEEFKPDILFLDLRLTPSDHNKKERLEDYTGMQLVKMIKEINPGIQIIMMSATSKSVILEELYRHGILGYIKKEHPDDVELNSVENIKKLYNLVEKGLKRRYLKQIYTLQEEALKLSILDREDQKALKLELESIFEVLNSDMEKRFVYALMSLYTILESINKMFIEEEWLEKNKKIAKWKDTQEPIYSDGHTSAKNKISSILHSKVYKPKYKDDLYDMLDIRNDIIHEPTKENFDKVDSRHIQEWFVKLVNILKEIEKRELL